MYLLRLFWTARRLTEWFPMELWWLCRSLDIDLWQTLHDRQYRFASEWSPWQKKSPIIFSAVFLEPIAKCPPIKVATPVSNTTWERWVDKAYPLVSRSFIMNWPRYPLPLVDTSCLSTFFRILIRDGSFSWSRRKSSAVTDSFWCGTFSALRGSFFFSR